MLWKVDNMKTMLRLPLLALALAFTACGGDSTAPTPAVPTGTYRLATTEPGVGPLSISVFVESSSATSLGGMFSAPGASGRFTDGAWQVDGYRLVMGPYIVKLASQNGAVVCTDGILIHNPGPQAEFWPCTVTSQP